MAKRRGRSEGSIFQRQDGRWCANISLGWSNGTRKRKAFYGSTAAEVREKLLRARADLAGGLPIATERQTVALFLADWLETSVKPSVRILTYRLYAQHVRLYLAPLLGKHPLIKLAPFHLRAFVAQKLEDGLAPCTVKQMLSILSRALSQAVKDGLIPRNVAKLVDSPRIGQFEGKTLSPEQARAFLDAARGSRLEALYAAVITLGLREGEALGLRWQDIDLERRTLTVNHTLQRIGHGQERTLQFVEPKTKRSRRTVSLSDTAIQAFKAHRLRQLEQRMLEGPDWEEHGLVFPTRRGLPMAASTLTLDFRRILAKANLPRIRFHDLRHSAASLMLAQGVPLRSIMEVLGHSSIAITANLYTHVGEQLKREIADRMDELLSRKG